MDDVKQDQTISQNQDELEPPNYGDVKYWDNRYLDKNQFDWYQEWEDLLQYLEPFFNGDELVLNIGCGNSKMSYEMTKTTFKKVISIDFSQVVIDQMKELYRYNNNLEWYTMDCTKMSFEDKTLDVVFDKGTIDALFCSEDPFDSIINTLEETFRVLKYSGLFILISFGKPKDRKHIFESCGLHWHLLNPIQIPNPKKDRAYHYIYIFQKINPGISKKDFAKEYFHYDDYSSEEEEMNDDSTNDLIEMT